MLDAYYAVKTVHVLSAVVLAGAAGTVLVADARPGHATRLAGALDAVVHAVLLPALILLLVTGGALVALPNEEWERGGGREGWIVYGFLLWSGILAAAAYATIALRLPEEGPALTGARRAFAVAAGLAAVAIGVMVLKPGF